MRCFRHEDTDEVFSPFMFIIYLSTPFPWNARASALLQLLLLLLLLLLLMFLIHTPHCS
jgi:hypothetical protein